MSIKTALVRHTAEIMASRIPIVKYNFALLDPSHIAQEAKMVPTIDNPRHGPEAKKKPIMPMDANNKYTVPISVGSRSIFATK